MKRNYYVEAECPICGGVFFPIEGWAYRDGARNVCSYSCQLAAEESKPKKRRGVKRVVQYSLDGEVIAIHDSATKASEALGCVPSTIFTACRGANHHRAKGYIFKYYEE